MGTLYGAVDAEGDLGGFVSMLYSDVKGERTRWTILEVIGFVQDI